MTWLGPDVMVRGTPEGASCSSPRMASRTSATTARTRSTPPGHAAAAPRSDRSTISPYGPTWPGNAMVIGRNTAPTRALEALPRRHRGTPVDRRGRQRQFGACPNRGQRHDVDRRSRVLPLRCRGRGQPLLDPPDGSGAAHRPRRLLRAPRADRRARRLSSAARHLGFRRRSGASRKLGVHVPAHRTQAARKFVPRARYMGNSTCTWRATACRSTCAASSSRWGCGKAVRQWGSADGARHRHPQWMADDGRRR